MSTVMNPAFPTAETRISAWRQMSLRFCVLEWQIGLPLCLEVGFHKGTGSILRQKQMAFNLNAGTGVPRISHKIHDISSLVILLGRRRPLIGPTAVLFSTP